MALTAVELFAGVGGFRLGLEGRVKSNNSPFHVIWANQWEPATKRQHAAEIYAKRFDLNVTLDDCEVFAGRNGDQLVNKNINDVLIDTIPAHDLLCGGFPCQDYSVARTLSGEMGIEGEKGKLWTSIKHILQQIKVKPRVVFLENVPRLINSPASQRGLNFTVIINDLLDLGYDVEWRIVNAADYGFPQKRKRIFMLAYLKDSISNLPTGTGQEKDILTRIQTWLSQPDDMDSENRSGPFSKSLPIKPIQLSGKQKISFEPSKMNKSPYQNTGYAWRDQNMNKWSVTGKSTPIFDGSSQVLGDVIESEHSKEYVITDREKLRKYRYVKGEQKEWRIRKEDQDRALEIEAEDGLNLWDFYKTLTAKYDSMAWANSRTNSGFIAGFANGIIYNYTAGKMAFPDPLSKPSRTVVTAEIGKSVSRMRHVIEFEKAQFRRLMPIELERLNGFPDDWTKMEGVSDSKRGFLMGNALVIGIVEQISLSLVKLMSRG